MLNLINDLNLKMEMFIVDIQMN